MVRRRSSYLLYRDDLCESRVPPRQRSPLLVQVIVSVVDRSHARVGVIRDPVNHEPRDLGLRQSRHSRGCCAAQIMKGEITLLFHFGCDADFVHPRFIFAHRHGGYSACRENERAVVVLQALDQSHCLWPERDQMLASVLATRRRDRPSRHLEIDLVLRHAEYLARTLRREQAEPEEGCNLGRLSIERVPQLLDLGIRQYALSRAFLARAWEVVGRADRASVQHADPDCIVVDFADERDGAIRLDGRSALDYATRERVDVAIASAFLPVIDMLHSYFGIDSDDDPRNRREKVGGKVVLLDRSLEDASLTAWNALWLL